MSLIIILWQWQTLVHGINIMGVGNRNATDKMWITELNMEKYFYTGMVLY